MASMILCNRRGGKCARLTIDGVHLSAKVADFRRLVAEKIQAPSHEIELLYCGYSLEDDKTLESYGTRAGVTIHALRKHDTEMQQDAPEKMDKAVVQQVMTALQAALINPAYRSTVERILTDPETLENIITATPGLDRDPVGISILQDPELLAMLADPNNIQKVIDEHPSLGQAAMMVAAAVNEEGVKSGSGGSSGSRTHSARGTYSLDQMSDDEDMEGPRTQMAAQASITTSQLAAALAAAEGSQGSGPSSTDPSQMPTTSSASPSTSAAAAASMITADFFRQAIQAASESVNANNSQPATATPTQEQPPHILQGQLEQLRDMGISDETAARNALQVTNGNLEAAIALLFGDGGF